MYSTQIVNNGLFRRKEKDQETNLKFVVGKTAILNNQIYDVLEITFNKRFNDYSVTLLRRGAKRVRKPTICVDLNGNEFAFYNQFSDFSTKNVYVPEDL